MHNPIRQLPMSSYSSAAHGSGTETPPALNNPPSISHTGEETKEEGGDDTQTLPAAEHETKPLKEPFKDPVKNKLKNLKRRRMSPIKVLPRRNPTLKRRRRIPPKWKLTRLPKENSSSICESIYESFKKRME